MGWLRQSLNEAKKRVDAWPQWKKDLQKVIKENEKINV
jgi:hypothetical protein